MIEIVPYSDRYKISLIDLWNREFSTQPNFFPLTSLEFEGRVLRRQSPFGTFHAETFLLAVENQREVVGFLHGDFFPPEVIQRVLQEPAFVKIGYVACFLVAVRQRRRGIGTRLFEAFSQKLYDLDAARIVLDTRGLNPFYGNIDAPSPILWGTPEGIGIQESAQETAAFLSSRGFIPHAQAVSLRWTLAPGIRGEGKDSFLFLPKKYTVSGESYELVPLGRKMPLLEKPVGELTLFNTNHPLTTLAWVGPASGRSSFSGKDVLGYGIAFPLHSAEDTHYGMYELNLHDSMKGKGLGKKLLQALLHCVQEQGGKTLETVVIPSESPEAYALYQSLGFQETSRWLLF